MSPKEEEKKAGDAEEIETQSVYSKMRKSLKQNIPVEKEDIKLIVFDIFATRQRFKYSSKDVIR